MLQFMGKYIRGVRSVLSTLKENLLILLKATYTCSGDDLYVFSLVRIISLQTSNCPCSGQRTIGKDYSYLRNSPGIM